MDLFNYRSLTFTQLLMNNFQVGMNIIIIIIIIIISTEFILKQITFIMILIVLAHHSQMNGSSLLYSCEYYYATLKSCCHMQTGPNDKSKRINSYAFNHFEKILDDVLVLEREIMSESM